MTELPQGWVEAPLGSVTRVEYGRSLVRRARDASGKIPVYGSAGVAGFHSEPLVSGPVVIVGRKGNAGATYVCESPCWPIDTTYYLRAPEGVDARFIAHFLRNARLSTLDSSTAIPSLRRGDLEAQMVPIAPTREQRRIVAAIEEHFSHLDAAEESLRRAGARLRVMRDAVYMRAISGAWTKVPLRSLLRERLRNGHSAKPSQDGVGIRTLTLSAVTTGEFSEKNTKLTAADPTRVRDLWLEPGDILIERSNTPELVGTAALYRGPHQWAIFPDLLIRIRVSQLVLPEFLEAALKARPIRRYFQRVAQGIAGSMPKIDQTDVANLEVPLPPLGEQRRIVAEVERQLSAVDAMAAEINRALKRSAALRRSILEQAFSGKLVPQDPSDEPASVLLERILAARESQPARRRRRAVRV